MSINTVTCVAEAREGQRMELVPPVLPSLADQLEQYLLRPDLLPVHSPGPAQQSWAREPRPLGLLHTPSLPSDYELRAVRDPATGRVTDWREERRSDAGSTARNSSSMQVLVTPLL